MKKREKKTLRSDLILFNIMVLIYLVAIAIMLGTGSSVNLQSFIVAASMSLSIIVGYNMGLIQGLFTSLAFVFLYGTYLLYGSLISGQYAEVKVDTVIWLFWVPLAAFVTGHLRNAIDNIFTLQDKYSAIERFITVDELTGMSNAQGFFQKLEEEVSRAKRFKQPLSLLFIVIHNLNEMSKIYGVNGVAEIRKAIAEKINDNTRKVDLKGIVEDNSIGLILTGTNLEGAEVVQRKIYLALGRISVLIEGKKKVIKLKVIIGKATFSDEEDSLSFYDKAKEDNRFAVG